MIYVRDEDKKEVGNICACIGGGIELQIKGDGRIFYISGHDIWNAFVEMMKKPELKAKGYIKRSNPGKRGRYE